ncbi:hypothetical protein F4803DRAFT_544935 [Xylaria telfairii]|nr:hypothetical protein F4803DRAFT_544935 [Xylaria telfairii]
MMAEVIGAIAAATQLGGYCVRLVEGLYTGANASRMLKEYETHLLGLKEICASIQNTPSLQTSQVLSCTSRIISAIDKSDLLEIIKKPSFVRSCYFVVSRRSLFEFFQQLESYKNNLGLCITTINSSKLGTLEEGFRSMSPLNNRNAAEALSNMEPDPMEGEEPAQHNQKALRKAMTHCEQEAQNSTLTSPGRNAATLGFFSQRQANSHGDMNVGPDITRPNTTGKPLNDALGGYVYKNNQMAKDPSHMQGGGGTPETGTQREMTVGPRFRGDAEPEHIGGAWVGNKMCADGNMQVGPTWRY